MKPKELETLTTTLKRSRGRSKKRYQLFCFLKDENHVHEYAVITKLYGDSENSKQNYRKLVQRLEKDILGIMEKHNVHVNSIKQMERGILSVQRLNILLSSDYGANLIQSEFESMEKQAKDNQLFLNQVLLERAKCESLYMSSCPLVSIEKMKSIHEISKFVTEAKLFHLSCKRYYLIEGGDRELLDKIQTIIHAYYIKCNEPLIGFHYHAGSIIMNFIKNESETCSYHIDQLEYLAQKYEVFSKGSLNDEIVLLKFLCTSLKLNGSDELEKLLDQNFYGSFNSSKASLLERIQSNPFELDIFIRFLIIREEYKTALFLIHSVVKSGLFKQNEQLIQRLDKYNLIASCISENYSNVKIILDKIRSNRRTYDTIRLYVPIYKFIIHSELPTTNFLDNLDSFRRNLRRNVTLFEESGLSVKEANLLQTVYKILLNRLSNKGTVIDFENNLLNDLKANFNIQYINQIHALVLIKWLDNCSNVSSNNHYLTSENKVNKRTNPRQSF